MKNSTARSSKFSHALQGAIFSLLILSSILITFSSKGNRVTAFFVTLPSSLSKTHSASHSLALKTRFWSSTERRRKESNELKNAKRDDNSNIDKGLNLLGVASKFVPQGNIVKLAKFGWNFIWLRFMTELAPQNVSAGSYERPSYGFKRIIGDDDQPIESRRYHLYVGNPCPWCHKTRLVVNTVPGLRSKLHGLSTLVDDPTRASRGGWIFNNADNFSSAASTENKDDASIIPLPTFNDLRELYEYLSPGYTGRCTAPLLVDWKSKVIVSNESKDIVRMLPLLLQTNDDENDENDVSNNVVLLDPRHIPNELQRTIDENNKWIYEMINNGVYKCGFSTSQKAYNDASRDVLSGLSRVEMILSKKNQKFVSSKDYFTESDVMLLPTLLRFDGVYGPLFRAGGVPTKRIEYDYPNTFRYMQRCWNSVEGVKTSIDITDACESYYKQLFPLNAGSKIPNPRITSESLNLEL